MSRTIKFIKAKTEVPIVKFTLDDDTEAYAVLDTGSEVSLFDAKFVLEHKSLFQISKPANKISFVGLKSEEEALLVNAYAHVNFDTVEKMKVRWAIPKAIVTKLSFTESLESENNLKHKVVAIFGSDFLTDIAAKINFKNKTVSFNYDLSGE